MDSFTYSYPVLQLVVTTGSCRSSNTLTDSLTDDFKLFEGFSLLVSEGLLSVRNATFPPHSAALCSMRDASDIRGVQEIPGYFSITLSFHLHPCDESPLPPINSGKVFD